MNVVFVAGATGYVGQEIVRQLGVRARLDPDVRVVAHVRPDSPQLETWRERFTAAGAEVSTAAWSRAEMAEALRTTQATHLFCLIGTTRKRAKAVGLADPYRAIDLGLTQLLVEAAQDVRGPAGAAPRFVYLSSIGASPSASSAYLRARGEAEAVVAASGLSHLIARPSIITGADREDSRPGERAAAVVADGAMALLGAFGARRLRDRWRSTDAGALAGTLIRLGLDERGNRVVESDELQRSARDAAAGA